ncbi:TnsD family Tn7-like transposition protein [Photobacterium damselae]|uniref:Transposase n=1 Tax=Photobacterium damselae TaxID=38293 RepID=A0ABD6X120_PHODM|nr:TnsD family Tn7-like transposition protein [Photobacterium damselae]OBU45466.1 hypothetical protein AYY27_14115 [Photobacterium damselae]PSU15822.1 transposase [Photobacterium damselae]
MQLPKALLGESLHSRICRGLSYTGYTKQQYLEFLFGSVRASIHPYLALGVKDIALATGEDAVMLLQHQTLNPLFAFLLPIYSRKILCTSTSSIEMFRACQLSAFREKEVPCAKFCPLCAQEDLREYGFSYWRLASQISGVEACSKHSVWLHHQPLPSREHIEQAYLPMSKQSVDSTPLAADFALFCEKTLTQIQDSSLTRIDYKICLNELGFVTREGQIRRQKLCRALYQLCLETLPENSIWRPQFEDDYSFWANIVHNNYNQPPFKHLLLRYYISLQVNTKKPIIEFPVASRHSKQSKEQQCIELLRKGFSMVATSRAIGKSRCYVKSVALRHDIPVNLKPKVLTPEVKRKIIVLARKGFHRNAIAQRFELSAGSVEMVISSEEGLVEWRKQCKSQSTCRRYKIEIVRYVTAHPKATKQQLKQSCEAAFFWLYTHEKKWLNSVSPNPIPTAPSPKVDWSTRDRQLYEQLRMLLDNYPIIPSRTELERMLGVNGLLTSKKEKLPRTTSFIKEKYRQN